MYEQGSLEWYQERLGFCTASNFSFVLRDGDKKTRQKYLRRVVAERLTKKPLDDFNNTHMQRGKEQEPFARMAYEARTGNIVDKVGFIKHKKVMAGASPDGRIGKIGGIEAKCVIPTVQIETIEKAECPNIHIPQIQGNIWITDCKWWDFVSYSPDMPEPLDMFIFRVKRDQKYIDELELGVRVFLDEVDILILKLMGGMK